LARLNGTTGRAGPRQGGQLQEIPSPGGAQVFTQPTSWRHGGRTYVFVATNNGTAAYVITGGRRPRMTLVAQNPAAGTSPILAGGLLYVYDPAGSLKAYEPTHLRQLASFPAASGHWNSPIAIGGRIIVPEGDAKTHSTSGAVDVYHLPGR